jgi:CCR4-NOT transcription complex subunit 2
MNGEILNLQQFISADIYAFCSNNPRINSVLCSVTGTITNIPKHMVTDQFGMIGLLTFIRAAETEPNLVTLALGR